MANFLTNLLFEPKGIHDPSKAYTIKDTVSNLDASKVYFALQDVPAGISLDNTDYWILQMDLSASKDAMDSAAANARSQTEEAVNSANVRVNDMMQSVSNAVGGITGYAEKIGMRTKGETAFAKGNPIQITPDGGSLIKAVTTLDLKQEGSGDPYPMGGGKNLLNISPFLSDWANNNNQILNTLNSLPAGTYVFSAEWKLNTVGADAGWDYYGYSLDKSDGNSIGGKYAWETTEIGSVKSRADAFTITNEDVGTFVGAYFYGRGNDNVGSTGTATVQNVQIEVGNAFTGYAPPSNIRPFIGYDEIRLNTVGKNLFNQSLFTEHEFELVGWFYRTTKPILPAGTYTWTKKNFESTVPGISVSLQNEAANSVVHYLSGSENAIITSTEPLYLAVNYEIPGFMNTSIIEGQLELGSAATPYEPYQGKTHTVQIGDTVYGGKFDWLTGKMAKEWDGRTFDGTENWAMQTNVNGSVRFWLHDDSFDVGNNENVLNTKKCSHAKEVLNANGTYGARNSFAIYAAKDLYINLGFYTLDEWKAYLAAQHAAGTPVQVVYKLAEPIEIQLAPTPVFATEQEGLNYIYGDGEIEVEYVKPLNVTIKDKIDTTVDDTVSTLLRDISSIESSEGNPVVIKDPVPNVGLVGVTQTFEPKQTGNGDPYPAGGGKNLFDVATHPVSDQVEFVSDRTVSKNGEIISIASSGIQYPNAALLAVEPLTLPAGTYTMVLTNTLPFTVRANSYLIVDPGRTFATMTFSEPITIDHIAMDCATGQTFDVSFGICIRADNVAEYVTYSNIRPIIGYDALDLNVAGKNLLSSDKFVFYSGDTVMWTAFDSPISVKAGNSYILSVSKTASQISIHDESTGGNAIGALENVGDATSLKYTPDKDRRVTLRVAFSEAIAREVSYQFEIGSTSSSHEPYKCNAYTAQLGQTIYGGKYDWLTGKLVAEWGKTILTGKEVWSSNSSGNSTYFSANNVINIGERILLQASGISSHFPVKNYSATDETQAIGGWDTSIYLRWAKSFKTVDELKAYLSSQYAAGTPVQVVYELAEPIEIQLDKHRITTLDGTNTIYGDGTFKIDWARSYKAIAEERENTLLTSFTDEFEVTGEVVTCEPVVGVKFDKIETVLEPQQEGSGDPYPYLGGKNIFPPWHEDRFEMNGVTFTKQADGSIRAQGTPTAHAYITLTDYKTLREHGFSEGYYTVHGFPAMSDAWYVDLLGDANTQNINFYQNGVRDFTDAVAGNGTYAWRIVIAPNMGAVDLVFKIQLEKGTVATEWQSSENIRPFIGYDALELNHAGKNLFTGWVRGERVNSNTGAFYAVVTSARTEYIPVKPSKQMQVIGLTETMNSFIAFYDSGKNFISRTNAYGSSHRNISTPDNCHYIVITQYEYTGMTGVIADLSDEVQLEYGATIPTEYTVPTGIKEYTIQIGQTVYGGRIDWLTGKLVADVALLTLTGNESILRVGTKQFSVSANVPVLNTGYKVNDALCSHFPYNPSSYGSSINGIVTNDGQIIIRYPSLSEDTKSAFATFLSAQYASGTPVQIAYKLATPTTIQLTPTEIIALSGVNTLYSDGNTITAKFRQSKTISLEERLSALEAVFLNQ